MIVAYVAKKDPIDLSMLGEEFLHIQHLGSLDAFLQFFESTKHKAVALIYQIQTKEDLAELTSVSFTDNIFLIVIGPRDTTLALEAGQIGADRYLVRDELDIQHLIALLYEGQRKIKKRRGQSQVVIFSGIHGGAGTTTIAMNSAALLANDFLKNRVLFMDLSFKKGIANLFFDNPNPKKSIVTLLSEEFSDFQHMINNGIYQFQNNFYYIPGIQFHTDREELQKSETIQKMFYLINLAKRYFNYIVIDCGVFEDVDLLVDMHDIADSIFSVTSLNIPSLSILATYLVITQKSGWHAKTHIVANRYDASGMIGVEEAQKLINKSTKKRYTIDCLLPNDWKVVNEAWNETELVALTKSTSRFVQALQTDIENLLIKTGEKPATSPKGWRKYLPWA